MPVPAMPRPGLVMVEPELVLGGFEAVLDRPAVTLDSDQGLDAGSSRTPGRKEGEFAITDGTAD
jgi:hypothetical protein